VRSLGRKRDPVVAKAMLEHLGAEDARLRHHALGLLGRTAGSDAAGRLLRHLDEVPGDRAVTAQALGDLGNRAAVEPLVSTLAASGEAGVRASCAHTLGRLGDRRAVVPLVRALRREEDALAANRQIEALATLGDPRAIAGLVAMLDSTLVCRQPRTISSIWVFPWNTASARAALWAARTLRDGEPPHGLDRVFGFPDPPPPHPEDLAAFRAWWKDHAEDPRYRLPD
jgi:HEAT repeat protein